MNTREREVMDALATAARRMLAWIDERDMGCNAECGNPECKTKTLRSSVAAYDALLAEGSASSEGAEAEMRAFVQVHEIVATYTNPQPAQGEPATVDALAQFIREIDGKHELGAGALAEKIVERFALPRGAHEQRSCEGSLPVTAWSGCGGTGEVDSGGTMPWGAPAMIECSGCPDCEGSERRPIADEVEERAAIAAWGQYPTSAPMPARGSAFRRGISAALESALPRGLPAGSDALMKHTTEVVAHMPLGDAEFSRLVGDADSVIRDFIATAEQPSCGQDARDAWQPIETAPKNSRPVDLWRDGERLTNYRRVVLGRGNVFYEAVESGYTCVRDATHWMPLPEPPAAIAAQQRQGGAK